MPSGQCAGRPCRGACDGRSSDDVLRSAPAAWALGGSLAMAGSRRRYRLLQGPGNFCPGWRSLLGRPVGDLASHPVMATHPVPCFFRLGSVGSHYGARSLDRGGRGAFPSPIPGATSCRSSLISTCHAAGIRRPPNATRFGRRQACGSRRLRARLGLVQTLSAICHVSHEVENLS